MISGESGAGKTETAKYIIGHIISHCSSHKPNLQERILQVCVFETLDLLHKQANNCWGNSRDMCYLTIGESHVADTFKSSVYTMQGKLLNDS